VVEWWSIGALQRSKAALDIGNNSATLVEFGGVESQHCAEKNSGFMWFYMR
jgi:hypothetical protein